ncbi:DUF2799 domain-containing protein [Vibrio cortegadensis]|uniref:DUF2799 domain-containing protein n=1 Tax=Vibrio cortegadensis TaxID=1328770 RepID=A0ABV4M698_9VIBR
MCTINEYYKGLNVRKTIVVGLLIGLAGCAASTQQLAEDGDWSEIGYRDGLRGQTQRSYSALNKFGQANQADYDQGYLKGVAEYCNPDHAYQIGLSGFNYEGVCEGTEEAQRFRMEWQRGWADSNN